MTEGVQPAESITPNPPVPWGVGSSMGVVLPHWCGPVPAELRIDAALDDGQQRRLLLSARDSSEAW